MKPESVKLVAEAIAQSDGVSNWTSYSADEQDQLIAEAQAAIRAVMQTDEVRGLVEALEYYAAERNWPTRYIPLGNGHYARCFGLGHCTAFDARKALAELENKQ